LPNIEDFGKTQIGKKEGLKKKLMLGKKKRNKSERRKGVGLVNRYREERGKKRKVENP